MNDIYILTDYKGYFGSKQKSNWYQSGMNLNKLQHLFKKAGYNTLFKCFSDINFRKENYQNKLIIYTSAEDPGYFYKDYIEDIILGLHHQGAVLIPGFEFLRANNNKVFMEIMRDIMPFSSVHNIRTQHFGTVEKLMDKSDEYEYPLVIKAASGAMSKGVHLARNKKELQRYSKKISKTPNIIKALWEYKNYFKLSGKIRLTSNFRKKFIVQNFIKDLSGDWKVLVFGNRIYTLNRQNRKNDFRASGSGLFEFKEDVSYKFLDFAYSVFEQFNVPNISLDIGFDGDKYYLIEFQALYFGTKTLEFAPFFFEKEANKWLMKKASSDLEEVYVTSICNYIEGYK